ncbi:RagB/SusD family nutrient uptake outer membrane protein [Pedobacter deserti]|uniref:RagB/SusD family nutrient uptake outer membrane protein n=1 Tax=Pedobacter deserti TaxID=2817382 RepID=UPI00210D7DB2|nr:RagB/SusD family nutrient uptake outer membrane protein [Pedobacter sp. SYSU D00382]
MRLSHIIILFGMALLSTAGCKRFLDQEPLRQTSIKNVDQLQALIDNIPVTANVASGSADETNLTAAYSTDDTEIDPELYKESPSVAPLENILYYTFNIQQVADASLDALWTGEFRKIFLANTILENVEKVTGSEEQKGYVKADAHFIRAYSNWVLANYYCLPYSKDNLTTPGLPLKKSANVVESLKRSTLGETYEFILSDLNEAMKVAREDVDPLKRWRVTKRTVEAMFSRYYLFIGDYTKALEYSDRALASTTVSLKDYKTIVAGAPITYNNPPATLQVPQMYFWTNAESLYWPEFYYTRYTNNRSQFYMPSSSLLALFEGSNDLRYKWFMIENGGRRFGSVKREVIRYSFFSDGKQLPSGLTRAELILNKAEALARTNHIGDAMAAVNELRAMRFSSPTNLSAVNADQAISQVLNERRREFPFSMRWLDIRRFSVNNYPQDDVTVTRNFFKIGEGGVDVNTPQTYTLPTGSRRYMVPINGIDVNASGGQLQQNTY